MQKFLTGDDLFAHILLLQTVDARLVLVMEGPSDCDVVDPHLDDGVAQSIPGYGKRSVLRCIQLVDTTAARGVAGIVDPDFDFLLGQETQSRNLIYIDAYDMDTLIYSSGSVLTRVLSALTDREARGTHISKSGYAHPGEILERATRPLSAPRLASIKMGLGFDLDNFPLHLVVDKTSGAVNLPRLVELAQKRSGPTAGRNVADVQQQVEIELSLLVDARYTIRGRDLYRALPISWVRPGTGPN